MFFIKEIFGPTIQGEGPNVGVKCIFVRVAGCDFKCSWCDSKYAWDTSDATRFETKGLVENLLLMCWSTNTNHIILTGGNPCIYDFSDVIDALHLSGITVDVETQGSKYPKWLEKIDTVVISPKAPSSGQMDVFPLLEDYLKNSTNRNKIIVKIPIFNDEDFEFALRYYDLVEPYKNVKLYLSVGNTNTSEEGSIQERVLKDYEKLIYKTVNSRMKSVYILPQMHTLVWGNKIGV